MALNAAAESWKEVCTLSANLKNKVDRATESFSKGVVIFGAGACGLDAARYLATVGAETLFFIDNDPLKQNTSLEGIRILPPQALSATAAQIVFVANRQATKSICQQLSEMKIDSLSFDAFVVTSNFDHIAFVRNELLSGDRSRLTYDGILKTILTGDNAYCSAVMENNQYFAIPEFKNLENGHFVDAGAYVGDTVERFIWLNSGIFQKIYAFEPSAPLLNAMQYRIDRLCREWAVSKSDIVCEHAGLADKNTVLAITEPEILANTTLNYSGSENETQTDGTRCYSLDSYLAGRPATFIKADIEGMELAMLQGAKETIRQHKPKMALSIYHTPAHLFEIAKYVNDLVPAYRLAVRQHSTIFAESVLYCWIP